MAEKVKNILDSDDTMEAIEEYKKRLLKIEAELEKVRGCSPLTHGWQTQKLAKAERKWDELAKVRMFLINQIDEFEKIKSREECPAKMICQCGKGGNWDGYCKLKNDDRTVLKKKRGGKRKGSGRKKKEPTKVIRVPESKVEQVKQIIYSTFQKGDENFGG